MHSLPCKYWTKEKRYSSVTTRQNWPSCIKELLEKEPITSQIKNLILEEDMKIIHIWMPNNIVSKYTKEEFLELPQ